MRLWRRVRPVQLHDFLLGQSMVSRLGETSNTFSFFSSNYLGFYDSQFDLGICFIHGLVQRNQPPLLTWGLHASQFDVLLTMFHSNGLLGFFYQPTNKKGFVADEDEAERAEYLVRGIGGETKANLMASRTAKLGLPEGGNAAVLNDGFLVTAWNLKKNGGFGTTFFFKGWLVFRSFTTLFLGRGKNNHPILEKHFF